MSKAFDVEVEVQVDSERVETHTFSFPKTAGGVAAVEERALKKAQALYPDAESMRVVATTDYYLMSKFFPGL